MADLVTLLGIVALVLVVAVIRAMSAAVRKEAARLRFFAPVIGVGGDSTSSSRLGTGSDSKRSGGGDSRTQGRSRSRQETRIDRSRCDNPFS